MMNEKTFQSPTTPGLNIDFKNYIIELVCLNLDKTLGPRFWNKNIYWKKKYPREIKGISNLKKLIEESKFSLDEPLAQKILIGVIRKICIKSLSATKTINKIVSVFKKEYEKEYNNRVDASKTGTYDHNLCIKPNTDYVKVENKTKLDKIREFESE